MTRPSQANSGFIPDFCSIKMTFAVVVTAELLSVVLSIVDYASVDAFWSELSMRSLYIQWIALGSAALLCLARPLFRRLSGMASALLALTLILLMTLAVAEASYYLVWRTDPGQQHFMLLSKSLSVSLIISVLLLHYFYVQHQLRLQQQAEDNARFDALQARIRPHFLFNSMNTIAHLTRTDPLMAERVVEDLSDLFRATLSNSNSAVTLGDEIELAKGYLNIEKMRLGERLDFRLELDAVPQDALLPPLTLQPLLENAVYHGIEPAANGGYVRIHALTEQDQIKLEIINNCEAEANSSHRHGNHMAMENIQQRLNSYFAGQASLESERNDDVFRVRLTFPYQRTQA
ncbi:MAG: histidine kinase [Chromatiales bacterium]